VSADIIPIGAPSRGELWRRLRLAEAILNHRTVLPETTRVELLKVLRGESVAVPKPGEVS
jgi:hypothetical protein